MVTKRIIVLFSLLTCLVSVSTFAYDFEVEGICYNIIPKANAVEVTYKEQSDFMTKYQGTVTIPPSVSYNGVDYDVIAIGDDAFSECYNLSIVILPNTLKTIGNYAFLYCDNITSINIPNSVIHIGGAAFCGSGITSIEIPNSVTFMGYGVFAGCKSLEQVKLSDNLQTITNQLLQFCEKLKSITIPNGVSVIESNAFSGCTSLETVIIPNSVTTIGGGTFSSCSNLKTITLPEGLSILEAGMFRNCESLTSVTLPSKLQRINQRAFEACSSLVSIELPNSISKFDNGVFSSCTNLKSIKLPDQLTVIPNNCFRGCSNLEKVVIPSKVKKLDYSAFMNCKHLLNVYCYAENVPELNGNVFEGSDIIYSTLLVPNNSINQYRSTPIWNEFGNIKSIESDSDNPTTKKCAKPTISYQNGKLTFNCVTDGTTFHSTITDDDIRSFNGNEVQLGATYHISVYATKEGYQNSETATATLCWIDSEPKTEGLSDGMAQVSARAVMVKTEAGQLIVEGADDNTNIVVYSIDGVQVGSNTSRNGVASINTTLSKDSVAIVRIGNKSVKVIMR